jgi:thiol-disulfide isomerase/thioredoxin
MKVTVTGVDGEPLSEASVRFHSKDGQSIESLVTDDRGVATSPSVPADVLIGVSAPGHRAARWINGPESNESHIVLVPVTEGTAKDSSGRAVPDALITSQELRFRADGIAYLPRHEFANRENDWSTESGEFSLTTELNVFRRDRNILVIAVDDSVEKMAIASVPVSQLNQQLELTLQPVCLVEGQFVFETVASKLAFYADVIDERGQEIASVTPSVRVKDNKTIITFKLRLPAGHYELRGRGSTFYPEFSVPLLIPLEKRQFNFGSIEVESSGLSALVGKPAPELKVTTRSGEELLLSNMRGNVVVLDFWGHWCVPCVRAMPRLMEIAEQFGGQPVRWIAVHDPSLTSFEGLDDKLSKFEKDVWNRKMSLETVIDVAAQPDDRTGITADRYGVRDWPTLVVISADGIVVGSTTKMALPKELEELLDESR